MAIYHQYGDLPQIPPTVEEANYGHWSGETTYAQPVFRHEDHYRYNVTEHEVMSLQHTMKRFLNEPSPMTPNLLHAKFERPNHDYQYGPSHQPWVAPEFRYPSPDQTAVSENSSYAAPNEVQSPFHQYQYRPDDFTQCNVPYIPADHMQLACTGGSVNMRELQLEPEVEPEPVEEVDTVTVKAEAPIKPQSARTNDAALADDYRDSSEPREDISLRDGESVQPMTPEQESSSDTEYRPGQSRRRSSASNSNSSRNGQRRRLRNNKKKFSSANANRVIKRPNRNLAPSTMTNVYTDAQRNNLGTTHSHLHRQHGTDTQRYFPCPLSIYGCPSTFCSKNEWKRHVSTQHIKLGFWRCELCKASVDPSNDQASYYNDFNRKDLFTQHLRRMHMKPTGAKRDDVKWPVTEENIAETQVRCFMTLRKTPQQSQCIFCSEIFQGPMSWDLRMEHIGRHMERDRKDGVMGDAHTWIPDPDLEAWLYLEGIITKNKDGLFKIGDGKSRRPTAESDEE